jgi:hypothetical protein
MDFSEVRRAPDLAAALAHALRPSTQLLSDAWNDLQCMAEADDPRNCFEKREDYLECLHHRKEVRAPRLQCVQRRPQRDEPLTGGALRSSRG